MSLLFGRDEGSQRLAKQLFASKPTSKSQLSTKSESLPDALTGDRTKGTQLRDFPGYGPHLAYLQEKMQSWKPKTFSELLIPGYFDRLTWFTAAFGLFLGLIGVMSLLTSIIQLCLMIAAWKQPISYQSL